MPLFYKILAIVLLSMAAVTGYDLVQSRAGHSDPQARIRFDSAAGAFTFRKPMVSVNMVYASFMGPGEPLMRIDEKWISVFEEEYSDRLAETSGVKVSPEEARAFAGEVIAGVRPLLPHARRLMARVDEAADETSRSRRLSELADWLETKQILLKPLDARATAADKLGAYRKLLAGLEALGADPAAAQRVAVLPRLVDVERRWQGRWVLSANRPRFLTGRDVPDVILSDKLELLALVQEGYAVAMDQPLAGQTLSPLDGPDSWGDGARSWRAAFLPSLLEQGKYPFIDAAERRDHVYLVPTTCSAFCLFYNKVLFQKAGIEAPPRTWPEFMAACEKMKAAGIVPITADQAVYGDYWMTWLITRALGPEAWKGTVLGVADGSGRRSEPAWTDERYQRVFGEIRRMRENGYFDKDFRGSTWPAAQRGFAAGNAGMMICGTWLVQELSTYKDAGRGNFDLGCFSFPQWPGGREIDQKAAWGQAVGMMVCRQGRATPHAIELVKFLCTHEWPDMVYGTGNIAAQADAAFPPALEGIAEDFKNAPVLYSSDPTVYARRFNEAKLRPLYDNLLLMNKDESGYRGVKEFLETLSRETAAYLNSGGEAGYE